MPQLQKEAQDSSRIGEGCQVTHYVFHVNVAMIQHTFPKECWKPDCNEKSVFVFDFMDNQFPTCIGHADEFFKILKATYQIFLKLKGSDEV